MPPMHCKGTDRRPRANASRGTGSQRKCFYCKKYVALKENGRFRKHLPAPNDCGPSDNVFTDQEVTRTHKVKARVRKGTCAQCRGPVYEIDYLCEKCREKLC